MLGPMSALLFCLQVCPLDCNEAVDLARLISDIQCAYPAKCFPSWLISYRQDTPLSRVHQVQAFLVREFKNVWMARAKYFATGWPTGSNALWKSAMEDVAALAAHGKIRAEGVLTFEPDCTPTTADWIDRLEAEYRNRQRPIVGNIHQQETLCSHVNGNAMWPVDLATRWPQVLEVPPVHAWDYFHREFFLTQAQDTPLITQYYRRKSLTQAEWLGLRKHDLRPVLLHGVKDATARRLARQHILSGVPIPPGRYSRVSAY